MTPTHPADEFIELARELIDSLRCHDLDLSPEKYNKATKLGRSYRDLDIETIETSLRTLVQRKVREHNEECAKVAETAYNALHSQAAHLIADHIATKIRQRSSK